MKYLIASLITCLVGYLAGSFVMWSFNPGIWSFDNRMIVLFGILFLHMPSMGMASEYKRS